MTGPLMLLAVGATVAGFAFHGLFIGEDWRSFWGASIFIGADNHVLARMEELPGFVGILPTIMGVAGIALAYLMYMVRPELPGKLAGAFGPVYRFLLNKWYFDELYDAIFVRPYRALARQLWQVGDVAIIDGVPNGIASLTVDGSRQVVKIQTGSIAVYAFTMLIGLVLLVSILLFFR